MDYDVAWSAIGDINKDGVYIMTVDGIEVGIARQPMKSVFTFKPFQGSGIHPVKNIDLMENLKSLIKREVNPRWLQEQK